MDFRLNTFAAAALQENRCIKDLKEYLLAVCGDKDTKKKLKSLLEDKASTVGLLVCRRFVNFPYEMVPKMYDSLFDEVAWATEDEVGYQFVKHIRLCPFLYVCNELATCMSEANTRTPGLLPIQAVPAACKNLGGELNIHHVSFFL